MKRTRSLATGAASLLASLMFAGSAIAVPVDYDESGPGGDLGNNGTTGETVTEFTLDVGVNTVTGNASCETGCGGTTAVRDFDDMILTIQPGQVLTSATFNWTLEDGETVSTQFRLYDGTSAIPMNDLAGLNTVNMGTAPAMGSEGMFLLTLPLSAGSYLLDQVSIAVFDNQAASIDYTWTFTVVPLPPAVWLFMSGLLAMVGLSRRRKATT